jgi:hypothetical protein
MSEGQSQRSVTSSVQHRQEAEVAAAKDREQAATETAVTAARLAMAELTAVRSEVEVEAAAADAAHVAAAELEALRGSSISSSVSADGGTDDELMLVMEAMREQAAQWAAAHLQGGGTLGGRATDGGGSPDRRLGRWRSRPLQAA